MSSTNVNTKVINFIFDKEELLGIYTLSHAGATAHVSICKI